MSSFVRRRIEMSVQLANDTKTNQPSTFAESGTDTVDLTGHRIITRIQNSGAPAGSTASISVFGLAESIMNQLSTLGMAFNLVPKNVVTLKAGDDQNGLSVVFVGTIVQAYAEYSGQPMVPFVIEANSGVADATANAVPTSYSGSTSIADLFGGFARTMGLTLENSGVNGKIENPYYAGSIKTQMQAAAQDANINAEVVEGRILAIWPKGAARQQQGDMPIISAATGMIGYPSYTQQGIMLRSLFNPKVTFGGTIKVESAVKTVNDVGQWCVNQMNLALDSEQPKGLWEMGIAAYNPQQPKPIPNQPNVP